MSKIKLQDHIDILGTQSSTLAVPAIANLAPGLRTSVSYSGKRLITHDAYEGSAELNKLAYVYIAKGDCDENTPLKTRLQHHTLHAKFEDIYASSNAAVAATWGAKILTFFREFPFGCACCSGIAVYLIASRRSQNEAFFFSPEQYEELWPNEQPHGMTSTYNRDAKAWVHKFRATQEMVEEVALLSATHPASQVHQAAKVKPQIATSSSSQVSATENVRHQIRHRSTPSGHVQRSGV